ARNAALSAPRAKVLDEPCLADAGLPGQQDELRASGFEPSPEGDQTPPLVGTADQRWTTNSSDRALSGRGNSGRGQELLVSRARECRRLDPELALQRCRADVVHPQRPCPIAAPLVQPHQEPIRLLVKRLVAQQSLGALDGLSGVAASRQAIC